MDLPAILFLFLRNFYRSSTATPVAIDMTVVVQDMLLCFLFTDLYGFSMKVHSQEEEDPSHDQDQDWEENGIIIVLFVQILGLFQSRHHHSSRPHPRSTAMDANFLKRAFP